MSHLPGARRVDLQANANTAAGDLAKDAPIVTYCAVGYRSGAMSRRLRVAGYTQVQNLEGSIFQWANEHRSLVHGDERVSRVHPYNSFWGRLLEPDVRAAAGVMTAPASDPFVRLRCNGGRVARGAVRGLSCCGSVPARRPIRG